MLLRSKERKLLVKDMMNDLVKEKNINDRIKSQLSRPLRQYRVQELSFAATSISVVQDGVNRLMWNTIENSVRDNP